MRSVSRFILLVLGGWFAFAWLTRDVPTVEQAGDPITFSGTYAAIVHNSGSGLSGIVHVGTLAECLDYKNAANAVNRDLIQHASAGQAPGISTVEYQAMTAECWVTSVPHLTQDS